MRRTGSFSRSNPEVRFGVSDSYSLNYVARLVRSRSTFLALLAIVIWIAALIALRSRHVHIVDVRVDSGRIELRDKLPALLPVTISLFYREGMSALVTLDLQGCVMPEISVRGGPRQSAFEDRNQRCTSHVLISFHTYRLG